MIKVAGPVVAAIILIAGVFFVQNHPSSAAPASGVPKYRLVPWKDLYMPSLKQAVASETGRSVAESKLDLNSVSDKTVYTACEMTFNRLSAEGWEYEGTFQPTKDAQLIFVFMKKETAR